MTDSHQGKKPPQTSVERQRKYQASLKAQGFERISVTIPSTTAQAMRDIAAKHGKSCSDVVNLGVLSARRELSNSQHQGTQ